MTPAPAALLALAFVIGYLLGSIPFGVILTRLAGLGDVRSMGSGNIGATNVLRTGRRDIAALTLLADVLKGTGAVLLGQLAARLLFDQAMGPEAALCAGLGALLGHLFPAWIGFRGGKGVATFLGVVLGLFWPAAAGFALIWLAVAAITRFSSLAALLASVATPPILAAFGYWPAAGLALGLTALIWLRHLPNIRRLMAGTESRIGERR